MTYIGHAAFAAHDLDRTLAFYAQLGINELFRLHHADGSLMSVYLHVAGDRFVEVFPGGPPPDPQPHRQLYASVPGRRRSCMSQSSSCAHPA